MNKTITILKNYTQETLIIIAQNVIDVSELKTVFTDIRNLMVVREAIDVFELKTGFTEIRNLIIEEVGFNISKQMTGFNGIRDFMITQKAFDIPKQKTCLTFNHSERFDYLSMNSQGFINPCYHDHVIEHKTKILYTRFEIPSSTNTGVIISACNGASA